MDNFDEKSLEHLAKLAKLEIPEAKKEKFYNDFQNILDFFNELGEVDTSDVEPMNGGSALKNKFREDKLERETKLEISDYERERKNIIDAFPSSEENYLKIPPVFE